MKVLVISHMYPSSQNPVYGIFIHKQVKALKEQGCDMKVISPVPCAPWPLPLLKSKWKAYASVPRRDIVDGVEVYYPRYLEFPGSNLLHHSGYWMYRGFRKLVAFMYSDFKFDLIHANVALPDGHAAFLLKKEYNVPLVISIHGVDFQSTIYKGEKIRRKLFEVLQGSDRIITVSTKLKKIIQDQPFARKTEVINNGINLEECVSAAGRVSDAGTVNKPYRLLSVSNLKKTKGIDLNILAVSRLAKKYPNLTYYIVGDGEERQNLENLSAELNVKDSVIFLGSLEHQDAMKQMAEADIFCLPSWQEGFGVVYIEAMAHGLPVIAVWGEGIEDAIVHEQNGLLIRPQSVEAVIEALDSLLSNPAKAFALAKAGRQTVLNGFTWKKNAERTAGVYREVNRKNQRKHNTAKEEE